MVDEVRNKLQFWYYIQWRILHLRKSRVKMMNSQADDKTSLNLNPPPQRSGSCTVTYERNPTGALQPFKLDAAI